MCFSFTHIYSRDYFSHVQMKKHQAGKREKCMCRQMQDELLEASLITQILLSYNLGQNPMFFLRHFLHTTLPAEKRPDMQAQKHFHQVPRFPRFSNCHQCIQSGFSGKSQLQSMITLNFFPFVVQGLSDIFLEFLGAPGKPLTLRRENSWRDKMQGKNDVRYISAVHLSFLHM